jgi:glutathione peroxidase
MGNNDNCLQAAAGKDVFMLKRYPVFLVIAFLVWGAGCKSEKPMAASTAEGEGGFYAFTVDGIDGDSVSLSDFEGKVVLVVNVASKCGFTKQYDDLQALYERYRDRGFVVLGFPANNFGNQEPGTNEEIRQFCTARFNVTFPMFSKISVRGDDMNPLYAYLTDNERNAPHGGAIQWNFTKFLIGKDGRTRGRFASAVNPLDAEVIEMLETALDEAHP